MQNAKCRSVSLLVCLSVFSLSNPLWILHNLKLYYVLSKNFVIFWLKFLYISCHLLGLGPIGIVFGLLFFEVNLIKFLIGNHKKYLKTIGYTVTQFKWGFYNNIYNNIRFVALVHAHQSFVY